MDILHKINLETFRNIPLSASTLTHLSKTYSTIASLLTVSTLSCYLSYTFPLLDSLANLSFIGTLASILYFLYLPATPANSTHRSASLYIFAFFKGLSIIPLMNYAIRVNSSNILTALGATALLFACFTGVVVYNPPSRISTLYIKGLASSLASITFWISMSNIFFGSATLYNAQIFLGLGLFSLYVVYDTQLMIRRAENGEKDHLMDAMRVYVDLFELFVRILIILSKKDEAENKKKRNK